MTISTDEQGRTVLTADEGRAIHRNTEPCGAVVAAILRSDDSPSNWSDCDITVPDDTATEADKDAALRRFGVEV